MAKEFSFGNEGKVQQRRLQDRNAESDALWEKHKGIALEQWPKSDLARLIELTRVLQDVRQKQADMAGMACDEMQKIVDEK